MTQSKNGIGRVAIVGGGISGVTLAIALIERGIDVQIYEQAHHFGEIGAGVAFNPAATRAMKKCSPKIHEAFESVSTRNQWPSKKNVWFDFLDARIDTEVGQEKHLYTLTNEDGANAVHRAHFLDALTQHVPEGTTHFNKHLDTIDELPDGQLKLRFHDATEALADLVIGCDGIKSRVRAWLLGDGHPAVPPRYTHKYAYRGLIPMDRARKELGDDLAMNAKAHLGQDGHFLTFAVNHGKTMNVVAFYTDPNEWPSDTKLTLPSEKEHVLRDFAHFGATVHKIIELLEPSLDCWAIFDTNDNPMPHYNKDKVCLLGDAGHATSPHHGAGAGMCIEDAAVMAALLEDPKVAQNEDKGIKAAFQAYNDQRLERTQWLVDSSRYCGELYDLRADKVGADFGMATEGYKKRCEMIWNGQVDKYISEAKEILAKSLS